MKLFLNFFTELDGVQISLSLAVLVLTWLIIHKFITTLFGLENYKAYITRQKQLKFDARKKYNNAKVELLDKTTNPIIKYLDKYLPSRNADKINKNLEFIEWSKYMDAKRYYALWVLLGFIGFILALIVYKDSKLIATILLVLMVGLLPYLYNNEIKTKKNRLLFQFPDFIRITQGYLNAGMTFQGALESSLPYIGSQWRPYIQGLIVDMKLNATSVALNNLKDKIDMFEVAEFLSMVVLVLDQGGDAKLAFESQAKNIQSVMFDLMEARVMKRNMMAQALQPLLLIDIILIFGLPMFYTISQTTAMM